MLISLRNINEEKYSQLVEFCRVHPNIVYIVKALGPWDFEADLEVEDVEEFRVILMQLKSEFSEIIRDYSTLQIYQVHKYNFCPSVPK
ncbi:hypothetical protein HYV86_00555 [Candidatus Woesearchaeota archaeon]|nr:hypothetical protein [Candidatus Woesearchaeota archaeon]